MKKVTDEKTGISFYIPNNWICKIGKDGDIKVFNPDKKNTMVAISITLSSRMEHITKGMTKAEILQLEWEYISKKKETIPENEKYAYHEINDKSLNQWRRLHFFVAKEHNINVLLICHPKHKDSEQKFIEQIIDSFFSSPVNIN